MQVGVYIPTSLHKLLPTECSVSGLIRQALKDAGEDNRLLIQAFATREAFNTNKGEIKKYTTYFPEDEHKAAVELADRYLLSLTQLIRILLEGALFNAGKWPPEQKD